MNKNECIAKGCDLYYRQNRIDFKTGIYRTIQQHKCKLCPNLELKQIKKCPKDE